MAAVAERQHGQVSRAQLENAGIRRASITNALGSRLFRTFAGAYSVGHPPLDRDAWLMAAVLACGEDALLGYQTGARVLGSRISDGDRIHVVLPRGRRVKCRGVVAHRSLILAEQDRWIVRGLPVLSPARVLLDLGDLVAALRLPVPELERAVHEMQIAHGLTLEQVDDVLDRAYGRRGAPRLARACVGRLQVSRSHLEDAYLRFIRRHSLPEPVMNHTLFHEGVPWEFDACFPGHGVVVELDGERFHATGFAQRRDRTKANVAAMFGLTLLRYAWHDLAGDDRRALAEHAQALAS